MHYFDKLAEIESQYEGLTAQLGKAEVLADPALYQKTAKSRADLTEIVEKFQEWKTINKSVKETKTLVDESSSDPEMKAMAHEELLELEKNEENDTGGSDGFIDNMLVTDDGHLVVVETKLWRSSEAIREVVSQSLHYAMAVSQLSPFEFEACLGRADPRWRRLGKGETVAQYVQNFAASNSLPGLPDDFEDTFDRLRRAGEILLLIVGDGIRRSAERLVHWINTTAGSAPYKLGLIELCLYNLPSAARIAVPRTLLRTREASRHVVSVNLQGTARDQVAVTVTEPDERPTGRKISPPGIPLTEERLTELIRSSNPPEIVEVADQLRALLGDDRFVECKARINSVAPVFYRPMDVDDPAKTNALMPKYGILKDKVEAFEVAVTEIAETVRDAMEAAS